MQLHLAEIQAGSGLWQYVWPCHGSIRLTLPKDLTLTSLDYWAWTRSSLTPFRGFSCTDHLIGKGKRHNLIYKVTELLTTEENPERVSQASGSVMTTHSSACTLTDSNRHQVWVEVLRSAHPPSTGLDEHHPSGEVTVAEHHSLDMFPLIWKNLKQRSQQGWFLLSLLFQSSDGCLPTVSLYGKEYLCDCMLRVPLPNRAQPCWITIHLNGLSKG